METQTLTPNQVKRLELIRSSLINIHDSDEFAKLDYQPDCYLGDGIQAIEELLDELNRTEAVKPVLSLTIRRRFTLTELLSKTMLVSFFVGGFFACGALFSGGVNAVNGVAPKNPVDNIDWQDVNEITTGLSMISLALSGVSALGIAASQIKE